MDKVKQSMKKKNSKPFSSLIESLMLFEKVLKNLPHFDIAVVAHFSSQVKYAIFKCKFVKNILCY